MKWEAWIWGFASLAIAVCSATGALIRISPVLVAVPATLFALGAGAFCIGRPRFATVGRILACIFAGIAAILAATQLPLRTSFAGSKGALNSAACDAAAGRFKPGVWAGCYCMKESQVDSSGNVYLWTSIDKRGRRGFVKTKAPIILSATHEVDLGEGWSYVYVPSRRPS